MIHITIYKNNKHGYVGFRAQGHAGQADYGQDIVCAAASILMINTTNSIEKFAHDDFSSLSDDESGLLDFQLKKEPSPEANLLLKSMVEGLITMEEDYEQYIDIIFEEV